MATFLLVHGSWLLVHGSWHGAWCWERLVPRLREHGHEAVAIDLPAHGEDRTPAWLVSMASYSERIRDAAAGLGAAPIVVGHSMGGFAVTQAAADSPGGFAALVSTPEALAQGLDELASLAGGAPTRPTRGARADRGRVD